MMSQALIPNIIESRFKNTHAVLTECAFVMLGVIMISILAQVAIPLPWTPVPITGQTFGVALCALLWGQKRALAVMVMYLGLGAVGMPIFALGKAHFIGASSGYLLGMLLSSQLVGALSDRGYAKNFWSAYLVATLGSVLVLGCGVLVLSLFMPIESLLVTGVLPFLPGDVIKNALAAKITVRLQPSYQK